MSDTIQLVVKVELADYLLATYWVIIRKFRFFIGFLMLVFGGYLLLLSLGRTTGSGRDVAWLLTVPPLAVLLVLLVLSFETWRNLNTNRALHEAIGYTFTQAGISTLGRTTASTTAWSNSMRAAESRRSILLFLSSSQYFLIPKRCFENDEHLKSFKELVRTRLGSKARLRSV